MRIIYHISALFNVIAAFAAALLYVYRARYECTCLDLGFTVLGMSSVIFVYYRVVRHVGTAFNHVADDIAPAIYVLKWTEFALGFVTLCNIIAGIAAIIGKCERRVELWAVVALYTTGFTVLTGIIRCAVDAGERRGTSQSMLANLVRDDGLESGHF